MARVRCTVDSCEFWGDGQVCSADEIWVRNDIEGDPDEFSNHFINASRTEFAEEFGNESEAGLERTNEAKPNPPAHLRRPAVTP